MVPLEYSPHMVSAPSTPAIISETTVRGETRLVGRGRP